ncbi:MAG TPA: DUF2634 domain-containing protein [Ruminiclostridium sp.]|nr:DUF2634 domain-containing protein [Ruminiclostridium sp.]
MSTTIFPIIQPQAEEIVSEPDVYKEVKWDFEKNIPIYQNGSPVIVTGKEAVLVWGWKALNTPRFRYEIYTWDYGCEVESLVGQPFIDELKQSEAARYVKECLLVNRYITGITDVTVSFKEGDINISCTIETVYGEADINV